MGLCSLPVVYLGPNYGGGSEDNGDLLQKVPCRHCCTQCPRPCSRPPPTHASSGYSLTFLGKSRSISCGVTVPFSWVLVHSSFCFFPLQESVPPDLCKFWWLYVGVNCDLLQECLCQTKAYCTQSPCPHSSPLLTCTSTGDTQTVLSQSLWGLWVLVCARFV